MKSWKHRLVAVGVLAALFSPVAVATEVAESENASPAQAAAYTQLRWVYHSTHAPGTGNGSITCGLTVGCVTWKWVYNGRGAYELWLLKPVPVYV